METERTILVTGSTRGLGYAIAKKFAAAGWRVALGGRTEASSRKAADALALECHTANIVPVWGELSTIAGTEALLAQVAALDAVHVLVNNAAITRDQLLLRMRPEDWHAVLHTNLTAVFMLTKAIVRGMLKRREGRIINIASVVGQMGNAGQANYAAAKGGLIAFTKSLARELAARNITVNALAPGFIETDMTAALPEAARLELLAAIPVGRFGTPQEVAHAVYFLAQPQAAYITGQVLAVNGGMYM